MKSLTLNVSSPSFEIALAGDTHEGAAHMHEKGIGELIEYVRSGPKRYWAHMGDWIEAITTDDKRYSHDASTDPIPLRQARAAVKMFSPIAKRCFCGLIGNHELKLHRFGNLVSDVICKELRIPYGGYLARVRVAYRQKTLFNMFLWHGPARGTINSNAKDYEQREANLKAALKMRLKYKMSDCAIMAIGHIHKLIIVPPSEQLYLHDSGSGIEQGYLQGEQVGPFIDTDRRWYVSTGAFLKLYEEGITGYAECAGYDPVDLGFAVVTVDSGRIVDIRKRIV